MSRCNNHTKSAFADYRRRRGRSGVARNLVSYGLAFCADDGAQSAKADFPWFQRRV